VGESNDSSFSFDSCYLIVDDDGGGGGGNVEEEEDNRTQHANKDV
jgi:hypothetical protein